MLRLVTQPLPVRDCHFHRIRSAQDALVASALFASALFASALVASALVASALAWLLLPWLQGRSNQGRSKSKQKQPRQKQLTQIFIGGGRLRLAGRPLDSLNGLHIPPRPYHREYRARCLAASDKLTSCSTGWEAAIGRRRALQAAAQN